MATIVIEKKKTDFLKTEIAKKLAFKYRGEYDYTAKVRSLENKDYFDKDLYLNNFNNVIKILTLSQDKKLYINTFDKVVEYRVLNSDIVVSIKKDNINRDFMILMNSFITLDIEHFRELFVKVD